MTLAWIRLSQISADAPDEADNRRVPPGSPTRQACQIFFNEEQAIGVGHSA
jgi:hypothetical protein